MSVILITSHDESIYDITKKPTDHKPQPHRRVKSSRRRSLITLRSTKSVRRYATMGQPKQPPPDPTDFLRKRSGVKPPREPEFCKLHKVKRDWHLDLTHKQRSEHDQGKEKNFIVLNIKKAIKMKPKEPVPRMVIEPRGTTVKLTEPCMKDFGKNPEYLRKFMRIQSKIYQMKKDYSVLEQPKYRYVTSEERVKILNGLKHNWDELQKEYSKLPILTDTIPKKMRKSKLESELKQLEKDIVLLERHPYIFVYNDDVDHFTD